MLTVAIDGTALLGVRTGVARFVHGLLDALAEGHTLDLTAYAVTLRGRRRLEQILPRGVRASTSPLPARLVHRMWRHTGHPRIERWTEPVDVVHATNVIAPPVHRPTIVTVHDLTALRYPEMCTPDTLRYPDAIRRALDAGARIHTTTDFIAQEVSDTFGVVFDEIARIAPGVDAHHEGDADAGRKLAGSTRYVLALGTVEPRKNMPVLVEAFDEVAASDPDVHLVVAGPDGWGVAAFDAAHAASAASDRIIRLGWITDTQRRNLLAGAHVFAYPSVYEGFGFPPLEAMQYGVPVVAADAGALPEVLGDAALLVPATDAGALADALRRVLGDADLRDSLVSAGHERVARYSWATAAESFAELYGEMA
ncbi:MAG: glycosyltransferase family 1 protein [Acidimicrobiia bacterium]